MVQGLINEIVFQKYAQIRKKKTTIKAYRVTFGYGNDDYSLQVSL